MIWLVSIYMTAVLLGAIVFVVCLARAKTTDDEPVELPTPDDAP